MLYVMVEQHKSKVLWKAKATIGVRSRNGIQALLVPYYGMVCVLHHSYIGMVLVLGSTIAATRQKLCYYYFM